MPAWETDDEYLSGPAAVSLPTPQDTPYRTPSRASRRSRRSVTPPGRTTPTPPVPNERADKSAKRSSKDITMDETISILDPRRFTPTLHANLVSEILALRRDQDEKTKLIESLESTLHNTREEQESMQQGLATTSKESRSLKRQLALLEGGTSSALGELARERDDAVEAISESRKRLDAAQKKIRSQEDDSQRVHDLWAQEKDGWNEERRKYDRKLHVAESRLKAVLEEVAAFQSNMHGGPHGVSNGHESDVEESGKEKDGTSVRSMSMTNSIRHSVINAPGSMKANGHSLADELNFDSDDDDQTDADGRESVQSHHASPVHTRNLSRESVMSRPHRRNQSLESIKRPGSVARSKLFMNQSVLEALEGDELEAAAPEIVYTDTGIQFSPPPSPKMQPAQPTTPEPSPPREKTSDTESPPRGDAEIEANQRRKRVQPSQPSIIEPPTTPMVSSGSQTVEEPISPPRTPKSTHRSLTPPPTIQKPVTADSSTQTEEPVPAPNDFMPATPSPPPLPIPSINIQPPTSRPTTPREPRLPQHFKHFGCQVNFSVDTATAEVGVQTEGIQIDRRLALLPNHLQPSAISSRPSSPSTPATAMADPDKNFTPVPGNLPPRNPRRLASKSAQNEVPSSPISTVEEDEPHDAYPGNNDDGPLSNQKGAPMKRPHRFSSLFAGFDTASSDEVDEFGDAEMSDSEYRTALSAPRPPSVSSRPGKRSSVGTAPTSPEQPPSKHQSAASSMKAIGTEVYSSFSLAEKENVSGKGAAGVGRTFEKSSGPPPGPSSRASVMRKAAMIQSGMVSQGRARSPSLPDSRSPPYPIPTRASSRKPPFAISAPSDGQRSPTGFDGWQRRNSGRNQYRTNSIRKVRSATALPRSQRYRRHGSRSPPPLSPSTEAPESPGLPPLPRNDITTPRNRERGNSHYRKHRHEVSTNTENTNNTDPVSQTSATQTTGVVDAIAQAMVGEWMFKYVRRRKSFGVPETGGRDESSNDRHKRWVWLAPYERAILWSSKQPSSGSALMGKTGRKLVIQSVLDVKDDNPPPKGISGGVFNRSILILTPQRALKFTATSSERHYIWLTALSFLAHSSQAVPEIVSPQATTSEQPLPEVDAPRPKSKRPGIRDSIRLAKGRNGPVPAGPPSIPSLPSAPSSQMGEAASFRAPDSFGAPSSSHTRETSQDAAEAPYIPRFHDRAPPPPPSVHGRKRSNTGGHVPPPLSFRGFSGPGPGHYPASSTAGVSVGTAGSSDIYQSQGSSSNTNNAWGMSQTTSQRTSEASSRPSNFFDAIGTVRMEAFISPLALSQFNDYPDEQDEFRHLVRRRSKELRRRQSRGSRHRDSYNSRGTRGTDDYYGGSRTAGEEDFFREDPFRGF